MLFWTPTYFASAFVSFVEPSQKNNNKPTTWRVDIHASQFWLALRKSDSQPMRIITTFWSCESLKISQFGFLFDLQTLATSAGFRRIWRPSGHKATGSDRSMLEMCLDAPGKVKIYLDDLLESSHQSFREDLIWSCFWHQPEFLCKRILLTMNKNLEL